MTVTPHLKKIENWVNNKALFEIIKDRNRVDTIIKAIDNKLITLKFICLK